MCSLSDWLVLVPTEKELQYLTLDQRLRIEICGFGPVAAAARTAALIAEHSPRQICLLYTSPSPRDLSTSRMPSSA